MRHAESDWSIKDCTDHDRPLNERGRTAAKIMGRMLQQVGDVPQVVITSSAVRALATVELAADAGEWAAGIETTQKLYHSTVNSALTVAAETPDDVDRLMLVGHQPTWGALVTHLTAESIPVRPATVVGIDCLARKWQDLLFGTGKLAFVLHPQMFSDSV